MMRRQARRSWLRPLLVSALLLHGPVAFASVESELAFHRGVQAFGEKRMDDARREFERALAADPNDATTLHYLGLVARAQGDSKGAVGYARRALAVTPNDPDLRFDLGADLLEAGDPGEALPQFQAVLAAQPHRARAHLLEGVSLYRLGRYRDAVAPLEQARQIDPSLTADASYYIGLSNSYLGDYAAAAAAFGSAANESPATPLGQSAIALRERMQQAPSQRPWALALTAGGEYDSNPRVIGQSSVNRKPDFRGVVKARASYRVFDNERFDWTVGYDGYLGVLADQTSVDLQTQSGWTEAAWHLDPVRLRLRYDFAYTWIELDSSYQAVHRVAPTVSLNEGRWGVSELYYQFQSYNYFDHNSDSGALNQKGPENSAGINQFLFPGEPVKYVRLGAMFDSYSPNGTEFDYRGFELMAGGGFSLPWEITLTANYSFSRFYFQNDSIFQPGTKRDDSVHQISLELVRPITRQLDVSVFGYYRNNDSNVATYDYDRVIAGSYLTYRF